MASRHTISRSLCLSAAVAAIVAGCATTGATLGSGVGDRILEHPPYYAGKALSADTLRVAHLPIAYQRGGSQAAIFDPPGGANSAMGRLLAEMNAYLDSLALSTRLTAGTPRGTPPDVRFSCELDASGDCTRDERGALGREGTTEMILAVGRPSAEWTAWLGGALQNVRSGGGSAHALVLTLEVGQYWTHQKGLRGSKEVELGTGYTVPLPWLTSLETPVSVLQLTGALVGADGKAVRIGAEGLFARRTRLLVSAAGGQELLSDEDVERVRTLRREDLPGRPLVWQAAVRTMVRELTGRRGSGR